MNHVASAAVRTSAAAVGVSPHDVAGRSRFHTIVRGRHEAWRALRELGWSFPEIASQFGVDHTTVLVALRKLEGCPRVHRKVRVATGDAPGESLRLREALAFYAGGADDHGRLAREALGLARVGEGADGGDEGGLSDGRRREEDGRGDGGDGTGDRAYLRVVR